MAKKLPRDEYLKPDHGLNSQCCQGCKDGERVKAKSYTSLFRRCRMIYKEGGLLKLVRVCIKYYQDQLRNKLLMSRSRYYALMGKRTFSFGSMKIAMLVTDYHDSYQLNYVYTTERLVIKEIIRELKQDDVFWDVGANLGFYSLLAANCSRSEIVAFEPHPTIVARLRKNIELNKKANVKILNLALSDTEGKAKFDPINLHTSSGEAHLANDKIIRTIEVETSTGDKLVKNGIVSRPDIVKIDVEGAEHLVIKGMGNILNSCRAMFCEVHSNIGQYGSSAADLETTLKNTGFSLRKIQNRDDSTYHLIARR